MASTQVLRSPDLAAHGPQTGRPPRITPNRRHLDDAFPVLGFTIFHELPGFYEVLLATNPAQLNVTGTRTPGTSYSSRQDSGLIPITLGTSVYLAPSAVLRKFVQATPRPDKIYYTVVFYVNQVAGQGVFAQPPETLASSASFVTISQHFGSDGFGDILGMNPDRMRRVMPVASQGVASDAAKSSPQDDRAEGEDGTTAPPPPVQPYSASAALDSDQDGYITHNDHGYGCNESQSCPVSAAESDYDDGYTGTPVIGSSIGLAIAQQNSFRPGDPEPAVLEDDAVDDDRDPHHYGSVEERSEPDHRSSYQASSTQASARSYDEDEDDIRGPYSSVSSNDGRGSAYPAQSEDKNASNGNYSGPSATAYGDEADQLTESVPAYRSLDAAAPVAAPLNIESKRDLIGKLGEYSAIRADGEFNGVDGPEHPAYRRYHLGLSFGIALFKQERGDLGRLVEAWKERDAAKFHEIFGPDAEALLHVLKAPGPPSSETPDGLSPRLQKVAGSYLWQEPWISRFREAGCHKPFQAMQNKVAAELYLDPMLRFAGWLGLNTERSLATVMDRAAELGVGQAQEWTVNSVGPLQAPAQRHQALQAMGFETIRSFQSAHPGTETNGQWGPLTHAAATSALRAKGSSPVPIPTLEQMLDSLVRRSARTPWFERVRAIRNDPRFGDSPLLLEQEHR